MNNYNTNINLKNINTFKSNKKKVKEHSNINQENFEKIKIDSQIIEVKNKINLNQTNNETPNKLLEANLYEDNLTKSICNDKTLTTDEKITFKVISKKKKSKDLIKKTSKNKRINHNKCNNISNENTKVISIDDFSNKNNKIPNSSILKTSKSILNIKTNTEKSTENIERIVNMKKDINLDDENKKVCKICYETEHKSNPIIIPCKCQGSVKFIHENCLKKWLLNMNNKKKFFCEICNFEYKLKIIYKYKFSLIKCWATFRDITLNLIVISIILVLILSVAYIIILAYYQLFKKELSIYLNLRGIK